MLAFHVLFVTCVCHSSNHSGKFFRNVVKLLPQAAAMLNHEALFPTPARNHSIKTKYRIRILQWVLLPTTFLAITSDYCKPFRELLFSEIEPRSRTYSGQ